MEQANLSILRSSCYFFISFDITSFVSWKKKKKKKNCLFIEGISPANHTGSHQGFKKMKKKKKKKNMKKKRTRTTRTRR